MYIPFYTRIFYIGYYRVKYDFKSLSLISNYLNSDKYEKIHVLNRAQIIDDTYYFLTRGEYTYDMFSNITNYLSQERDYVAWYPMFQIFRDMSSFLSFRESEPLQVSFDHLFRYKCQKECWKVVINCQYNTLGIFRMS